MKKNDLVNQKKAFFQKNPENMGRVKRFLAWITKGTAESGGGKASCST